MAETVQEALTELETFFAALGTQAAFAGDKSEEAEAKACFRHVKTLREALEGQPVKPATAGPRLNDLGNDAVMLLGLCEVLDVVNDAQDGDQSCPVARQARNGMVPLIAAVIDKARRLADDIERADDAARKGRAA